MLNISRRNFFKFLTLSAGATIVANASDENNTTSMFTAQKTQLLAKNGELEKIRLSDDLSEDALKALGLKLQLAQTADALPGD